MLQVHTNLTKPHIRHPKTRKWLNAQKSQEYNSSIFEFVNVEGSLVLRLKPKSRKFDLEIYFDGEDAVETGNAFELSARNSKPWTLKHPFYGNIICQPLSITQDNSQYNVSKFTIPVVETILEKYPKPTTIKEDVITNSVAVANEAQANAFANSGELNKVALASDVRYMDKIYSQIVTTNDEFLEFKNLVSDAGRNANTKVLPDTYYVILRGFKVVPIFTK